MKKISEYGSLMSTIGSKSRVAEEDFRTVKTEAMFKDAAGFRYRSSSVFLVLLGTGRGSL